ncbi:MAG: MBL fold metallo-hydrolase [Rikenellaceae bacterium]
MLKIAVFSFNPFGENTYVLMDDTKECIVVDAGNYSAKEDNALINYIRDNELKPVMALNTHGHVDHILGVSFVKQEFNVPFAMHSDDMSILNSSKEHGAMYGFDVKQIPSVEIDLKDKTEVSFGETVLKIIHTPGHTPGGVCIFVEQQNILITGDTLFKESIGRTDLPGGDYYAIMDSIINKIIPLGDEVKFYPGHGPASSLGHETLNNPFVVEVLREEVNYK